MARIQIIGESCRDIFVYCEAHRLAPDLPVPILQTVNTIENPGMAANVHRNILTKISDCELLTNLNWKNITKTRYIHQESNHMFIRIDSPHEIEPIDMSKIDYNVDAIVISDYHKGFLSEEAINEICSKHDLVFLDTKKIVKSWAEKATYIKINDYEFRNSEKYLNEILFSKIIRTRGAFGCDFQGTNYPVDSVEVKDTSGAGDSFIAALVIDFLRAQDIKSAIKVANESASRVVRSRGVAII